MPSEVDEKPFNIYINPSFNNQQKNFIHINPNVQLNVAVHFNPKMVNSMSASQFNKINQQQIQHVRQLSHNVPSAHKVPIVPRLPDVRSVDSKLNVQKSVYVNPKLMQQLKSKVPDVQQQTPISILPPSKFVSKQTLISKNNHNNYFLNNNKKFVSNIVNNKRVLINNNNKSLNNINTKSINVKKSSPSLISISKRKLIRVKPVSKFVLNNSPVKKLPVVVKKSPGKVNSLEQVRKMVSTSPVTKSVRLSPLDQAAKKLPPASKSLKLNNLSQYKKVNPRVATKSSPVAGKSPKLNLNQYKKINPRVATKSSPVAVKLPKINNFSQYKKVNTRGPVAGTSSRVKSNLGCSSSGNKYKLDRTKVEKKKIVNKNRISRCKPARSTNTNLIKIDGVMYKSSKSQLVKSSGSSQSTLLKKFNTVNRNSINNYRSKNIYRQIKSNSKITNLKSISTKVIVNKDSATTTTLLQRSNYKNFLSNRVKQKSIQILRHKMTKNNQPCLLFQRFGFCAKFNEGTCPKVHDKKQVALCKNFLQGKCLLDNCRLSHDVGPEKMPTCKYFLDGCCVRDSCQYLHVKVSANTPICIPFLQGYCEKGDQCKERHTNICPEFEKTEKCSKGKNCPYPHKSSTTAQNKKVYTKKKAKAITTLNKQPAIDNEKSDASSSSNALSIRDDSKKRYYDNDDCFDDTLASKKINIFKKLKIVKSYLSDSEQNHPSVALDSSVVIENNSTAHQQQPDKSSQPDSINFNFKRQPIGPLPAYIPI